MDSKIPHTDSKRALMTTKMREDHLTVRLQKATKETKQELRGRAQHKRPRNRRQAHSWKTCKNLDFELDRLSSLSRSKRQICPMSGEVLRLCFEKKIKRESMKFPKWLMLSRI